MRPIDRVDVHDDYNFTIHLIEPFAPIMYHLAHPIASILPAGHEQWVYDIYPIGTGPFRHELAIRDQGLLISRNFDYWGGAQESNINIILFEAVFDNQTAALATGEFDIALNIGAHDIADIEANDDLTLLRVPNMGVNYIGFNMANPYFSNPLVMQAISHALDFDAMIQEAFHGAGLPVSNIVPPQAFGYAQVAPFERNLDYARELLAQAGHANGFEFTIWYNIPNPQRQRIAYIVQENLAEIGIDVTVIGMEWAVYLDAIWAGEHDSFILGWNAATREAHTALYSLFHSSRTAHDGNRTFTNNERIDYLLDTARREVDPDARAQLYAEVQQLLRHYLPVIPINQTERFAATLPNVRGFTPDALGRHSFAGIYFVE